LGNLLPRQFRARVASPRAKLARLSRDLLEKELVWGQLSHADSSGSGWDHREWKLDMLRTPSFAKLPLANVQKLFKTMEEVPCVPGETVIREGDRGNYYYLIRSGRCRVVREVGGRETRIGTLDETDGFGDEALVSDRPRNASVIMETDGTLMRLSKTNFNALMKTPLLKRVSLAAALPAVDQGQALLIDVRTEDEFAHDRLPRAINVPIFLLYLKIRSMNRGLKYQVRGVLRQPGPERGGRFPAHAPRLRLLRARRGAPGSGRRQRLNPAYSDPVPFKYPLSPAAVPETVAGGTSPAPQPAPTFTAAKPEPCPAMTTNGRTGTCAVWTNWSRRRNSGRRPKTCCGAPSAGSPTPDTDWIAPWTGNWTGYAMRCGAGATPRPWTVLYGKRAAQR
jgi:CRP-like cAMP-binding protein